MGGATAAWLATFASAAATVFALGAARTRRRAPDISLRLELASRLLLTVAAASGMWALIRLGFAFRDQDYSIEYVANFSRRETSAAFRVAGIWGGMEGSLLLWASLSAVGAAWATWFMPGGLAHRAVRNAVCGAALTGLFATVVFIVNPFDRLDIPAVRGIGLVPILEHPAMLYHPPLLYLGLVLLLVPFADVVATAVNGRLTRDRALASGAASQAAFAAPRRWLMVSWILLVIGMSTGANWAYVELGWGGYWAWDPIENTALLPWLAATVALHLGRAPRSSPRALLGVVMLPFLLASMGTLLTRSGVTVSVHAFGEATAVGRALLVLLIGALLLTGLALYRLPGRPIGPIRPTNPDAPGAVLGRRRGLWVSVALFSAATFAVTAATVWPLVDDGAEGATRAIDGTFFSSILTPLTIIGLLAVSVAPALTDRVSWSEVPRYLYAPALGAVVTTLAATGVGGWPLMPTGLLIGAAGAAGYGTLGAAFRSIGARRTNPTPLGVHAIHLGFAFLIVAVAGSTATESTSITLAEGESVEVGGYDLTLRAVELRTQELEPAESVVAVVDIVRQGGDAGAGVTTLEPRRDVYVAREVVLPENALRSAPRDDIQIALRRADDNQALLDISVRPLAWWLWWSSGLMVLGGAATLIRALRRR